MNRIFEKFLMKNPEEAEKAKETMEETKNLEIKKEIEDLNNTKENKEKSPEELEKERKALDDLYNDKKRNEDGELPPYWQH